MPLFIVLCLRKLGQNNVARYGVRYRRLSPITGHVALESGEDDHSPGLFAGSLAAI